MSFTLPRTKALHEAILATGAESPYTEWLANWDPARDISPPGHHAGPVRASTSRSATRR